MPSNEPTIFGRNLRHYRNLKGVTQFSLAHAAGIPQGYISKLETGGSQDCYLSHAYALARALGVSIETLMGDEETLCHDTPGST